MSTKFSTVAADNLVALLQAPKAEMNTGTSIIDNSTVVQSTPSALCPVTRFLAKEDLSLTIGDLRKRSMQGKLWAGERNKVLSQLHRRLVRLGAAKEVGNEHFESTRQEIGNNNPVAQDDTTQTAIAAALIESNANMSIIMETLASMQKANKAMSAKFSRIKPSSFKK